MVLTISRTGMIWSVSMLMRRMGTAMPVTLTSCSIVRASVQRFAVVGDMAGDGRQRHRLGARQMRARVRPLAALEIAVGRADHPQIGEAVITEMGAQRTRRLMPLEAGLLEHLVQALRLGLRLHRR